MSLQDWLRNTWLVEHETSREEIADLLSVIDRDLHSLAFTLGSDGTTIAQLDTFRKKRNISDYERAGDTSDQAAREMISLAAKLREELVKWLQTQHPELAPDEPELPL